MEELVDKLIADPKALKAFVLEQLEKRDEEARLKEKLQFKTLELANAKNTIVHLEELLKLFRKQKFSPSSESHPSQPSLFNEAEADVKESEQSNSKVKGHERKRAKRRPLPSNLPRVTTVYELSENERACPCGGCLVEFSREVSEQLDIVPATVQVLRHERVKYSCSSCRSNVKTADKPRQLLPKTNASAGLLAYVATAKYADALPLYRQEQIFKRLGVDMARATLARWMIDLGNALRPIYNLLDDDLRDGKVMLMDETPVQVLKGTGKKATAKSFMWVRCRTGPDKKIVLFHYEPSRAAACARSLLSGFSGHLLTDGYEVYKSVVAVRPDITHAGCWDHARRKFFDADKASSSDNSVISTSKKALEDIGKLYAIERSFKEVPSRVRKRARQLYASPILKRLYEWAQKRSTQVLPKSLAGKALAYLLSEWSRLVRYLDDGDIPISNALAENAIRPFAVGRRNWLFCDTSKGAESSAIIYSLIETAKANGKDPYHYLRWLIERLPTAATCEELIQLLPYN